MSNRAASAPPGPSAAVTVRGAVVDGVVVAVVEAYFARTCWCCRA